jgi:hypothetical protein
VKRKRGQRNTPNWWKIDLWICPFFWGWSDIYYIIIIIHYWILSFRIKGPD